MNGTSYLIDQAIAKANRRERNLRRLDRAATILWVAALAVALYPVLESLV